MTKQVNVSEVGDQMPLADMIALYRTMRLIRAVEEKMSDLQKAGELPGPVHLYIGQEAIATGICAHLTDEDWIASTHRGHGHFIAKGGDPNAMLAEVFGREDGICHGKGGSMHVADFGRGIIGANGIVAGGVSLAAGAALATKLQNNGRVAVVFFGDGAANQGVIAETLNLAALWKLPLLLICENNLYSEFSHIDDVTAGEIHRRGEPYGVPSECIDGNDVQEVWNAADRAVRRARAGEGPTLIEARTYRFHGHVEYEDTFLSKPYRSKEEVAESRVNDPLVRFEKQLVSGDLAKPAELREIDREIMVIVEEAERFAKASPWPDASRAFTDMFA